MEVSYSVMTAASVDEALQRLQVQYPDYHCRLRYESPLQLLVGAILAAQCDEAEVNEIIPKLFAVFPTAEALSRAARPDIEHLIRPTGFYRQKARYLQMTCEMLVREYDGVVPDNMSDLVRLPGVARKIANLIMAELYGVNEGIAVDMCVKRVARRLGWSRGNSPERIERELMQLWPESKWHVASRILMCHGRNVCRPQPQCTKCSVNDMCPDSRT